MYRIILMMLACLNAYALQAQIFSGEYTTEWQWNFNNKTNWLNQLRLNLSIPVGKGNDSFEAATLHVAKTNETIIDDWQGFSNIEADDMFAAIAVLGYMHEWKSGHLFVGVRNVNEDFFTSDVTSLFANGSGGIFPTISASYPIANYPLSGLTIYFDVTKGGWTFRNSIYNGVGYNGWKHNNNPFIIKPKRDGIFNMSQLEYQYPKGHYFAGAALHTRHFKIDDEGEMATSDDATNNTTCAWWIYGEQTIWSVDDKNISAMLQYSENTNHSNGCYKFAEAGCAYKDSKNECGISAQYARFNQGTECSLELTWKRQLTESIALQPYFQYINNKNGDFTVLSTRLYYSF